MRILIDDGMQIKVGTGIGKYSLYLYKELEKALKGKAVVELSQYDKGDSSKQQGRLQYLRYINSRAFYVKSGNYDIIHFTNYAMPFIKNKKAKYVVTVHDLASFLYPESVSKLYSVYNRMVIRLAVWRADVILTVSESVRQEILDKWPKIRQKVKVAYPGIYSEYDSKSTIYEYHSDKLKNLDGEKFFLFVGTIESRKNLGIVIKAFVNMKETDKENKFKLILAGRPGFGYEEYEALIRESDCKNDIITTGYLVSDDVIKLYKEASAYVFPTVYEGFGSTQLECMVNHLPLILSDIPTNREVSADYGLYFDLGNIDHLQMRMEQIVQGDYDYITQNGLADQICKKYLWSNLIQSYIKAYNVDI